MKSFIENWLPPKIVFYLKQQRLKYRHYKRNAKSLFEKNVVLKDKHLSDRCFIIGTGSSIVKQDLKLLKDEYVIGVSGLFTHKDIESIQLNYHVLAPVFEYHAQYQDRLNYINWLKDMDDTLSDDVVMCIHIGDKKYIDENNIFKNKKIYWNDYAAWKESESIENIDLEYIPAIYSVSETAISTALYMGFKEIYLLGFDHDWFDATYIYFDKVAYMKHWKGLEDKSKKLGVDAEFQMRRHAQIFNKYKKLFALKKNIFNANSNLKSYVDTFPKVKYEELFNDRDS